MAETGGILHLFSGTSVSDSSGEKLAEISEIYRRAGFCAGAVSAGITGLFSWRHAGTGGQSFCRELERQIQERTQSYGGKVQRVQVTLSQGESMQIEKVEVYLLENPSGENRLRETLAASYDLHLSQVQIRAVGEVNGTVEDGP